MWTLVVVGQVAHSVWWWDTLSGDGPAPGPALGELMKGGRYTSSCYS